jgi:hypothetical protein
MDLLKKEEKNLIEPLVGLSKVGRGVLEDSDGIHAETKVIVPSERS